VASGAYQTKSSYYIDYNSYHGNTLNYSASKGNGYSAPTYRFATFSWNYIGSSPNNFIFTIKDFKATTIANVNVSATQNQYVNNGAYYFGSDPRFFLHYRVDSGSYSTLWIDGNSQYGTTTIETVPVMVDTIPSPTAANIATYVADNVVTMPSATSGYSLDSSDLVATLPNIAFGPINASYTIYCRIGFPMNTTDSTYSNYSFTDIQLKFT
jgi:hypothetical protein